MQSHRVQELGPESHQVGGEPGEVLTYLLGYLLWVVQHLGRQNSGSQGPPLHEATAAIILTILLTPLFRMNISVLRLDSSVYAITMPRT